MTATIQIAGQVIRSGRVFEIAADPTVEVSYLNDGDVMRPREKPLPRTAPGSFRRPRYLRWNFRLDRTDRTRGPP